MCVARSPLAPSPHTADALSPRVRLLMQSQGLWSIVEHTSGVWRECWAMLAPLVPLVPGPEVVFTAFGEPGSVRCAPSQPTSLVFLALAPSQSPPTRRSPPADPAGRPSAHAPDAGAHAHARRSTPADPAARRSPPLPHAHTHPPPPAPRAHPTRARGCPLGGSGSLALAGGSPSRNLVKIAEIRKISLEGAMLL